MATPRKNRSLDTLWRAFLFRHMPFLFEAPVPGESLGVDDETPLLVDRGTPQSPIRVLGRLYHALQVHGLSTADSESWQLKASLDGTVYADLGAAIVADGFIQVTSGLYGFFKVEADPIDALTVQYEGAGSAATIEVTADGHIIGTVTGGPGSEAFDLRLADYADYDALAAAIAAIASAGCPPAPVWTVTVETVGNTDAPTSLSVKAATAAKAAPVALTRGATILLGSMH